MEKKVWFVTGASRGLGFQLAKQALLSGENVVATARNSEHLFDALEGTEDTLLTVDLDVNDSTAISNAVDIVKKKFGRIDVLVNNAGYGQMGSFETVSKGAIQRQFEVNVFGVMEVTRIVLPIMRKNDGGHIFNLSSIGGSRGYPGASIYCSSKFAIEGFSEALAEEVAPYNINVTIVEPGFFRTDFLEPNSAVYGDVFVDAYNEVNRTYKDAFDGLSKKQPGDPSKLANALLTLVNVDMPPIRFAAGSDALESIGTDIAMKQLELAKWSKLTLSTDFTN